MVFYSASILSLKVGNYIYNSGMDIDPSPSPVGVAGVFVSGSPCCYSRIVIVTGDGYSVVLALAGLELICIHPRAVIE